MTFLYAGSLAALTLGALLQFLGVCSLLVTRQMETLLLCSIMASVFWAWCFWAFFLNKRRLGQILTGFCLLVTLILLVMGLLDMLDETGLNLVNTF